MLQYLFKSGASCSNYVLEGYIGNRWEFPDMRITCNPRKVMQYLATNRDKLVMFYYQTI